MPRLNRSQHPGATLSGFAERHFGNSLADAVSFLFLSQRSLDEVPPPVKSALSFGSALRCEVKN